MGLFGVKPPLDADEFEWLLACFAWLHRELGASIEGGAFVPPLATPDTPVLRAAANAEELFEGVKELAGLSQWHCVLERGDERRDIDRQGLVGEYSQKYGLGTFSVEGNTSVIRYAPELLRNPDALVATFAHELAHLVNGTMSEPPGGDDLHEHATDCTAVYLGFGVFQANSARQFSQYQDGLMQGWQSQASGYLSEAALATALALFVRLFGHNPRDAEAPLKPYLRKDFAKALKYIDKHLPDVPRAVAEADLSAWT